MPTTEEDEAARERDDVRCEAALQTMEDVLWRFNETSEGTLAAYDLLGFLVEDLIKEGFCAACIHETVNGALERTGLDLTKHREEDGETLMRGPNDVFH